MSHTTGVLRAVLAAAAAATLVVLGAAPAAAHVTITPSTTAAGATAVLRVEIPHGCEESSTTSFSLRLPEEVEDVSATDRGRWTVARADDGLTWTTDRPLPDGEHDEVEFSVRLPDTAGTTLVFPVVQRCEQGEVAWTEVAEHGEGHDDLDRPAPVVTVTGGDGTGDGRTGAEGSGDADATQDADTVETPGTEDTAAAAGAGEAAAAGAGEASGETGATGVVPRPVAYGVGGVLGLAALTGAIAVLRRRRQP